MRVKGDVLSPFAEYHGRKAADECEEFPLRRDSAPDEAAGRRYRAVRSWELHLPKAYGRALFVKFTGTKDTCFFPQKVR